jgi:hypothetical protein
MHINVHEIISSNSLFQSTEDVDRNASTMEILFSFTIPKIGCNKVKWAHYRAYKNPFF